MAKNGEILDEGCFHLEYKESTIDSIGRFFYNRGKHAPNTNGYRTVAVNQPDEKLGKFVKFILQDPKTTGIHPRLNIPYSLRSYSEVLKLWEEFDKVYFYGAVHALCIDCLCDRWIMPDDESDNCELCEQLENLQP